MRRFFGQHVRNQKRGTNRRQKGLQSTVLRAEALEPRILLTSLPAGFTEVQLATGIDRATSMDIGVDGRILIGERTGDVRIYQNGALQAAPLITLPVATEGEFGIHGVALDPNFATNNYFYVYYTVNETIRHNRVSRFEVDDDHAHLEDEFVLVDLDPLTNSTQHNGGAMNFAADGTLYVTTGENFVDAASRSLDNRLGKVLRYNPDGTIPTDNPFYNTAAGDNRAIWAIGLRNPYTAAIDPVTGAFYINDVGASSWEEINEGVAGGDYGWPITEGVAGNPLYEDPIHAYPHGFTGTTDGCAIVGGAFYSPTVAQFPEQYQGNYFFLDICNGWINQYDTATGNVTNFASGLPAAPVYLKVDDSGGLYYLTSNTGTGSLYRIDFPTDSPPTVTLDPVSQEVGVGQPVTFTVAAAGSQPFTYQWKRDDVEIPDATTSSYTVPVTSLADDGALFTAVVTNAFGTDTSAAATLTVLNGQAPTVTIASPAPGTTYNAGDTINWTATGDDNEDGPLDPAAFTYWVDLHHNVHSHSFIPETSGQASGSFQIPTTGESSSDVWYRIHVEVVDSHGLVGATFRDVTPNTSDITFQTSPAGLQMTLDGQPLVNPSTVQSVVGIERAVGVATAQVSGNEIYEFAGWSDAGAATHTISTPAANTTYTANFTPRVIDNEDPGYSEPAGTWSDNGELTGRDGSNIRSSSDPGAEARWTSPFPGGNRDVFFYKVVDPLNSTSAEISIVHSGQTDSVFLDLTQGTSGWVNLGRYAFDGLGAEYVGLTNAAGSGFLTADAVSLSNGQVPDNLLTAHWNFNEGTSTLADDSAPEGVSDPAILVGNALWINSGMEGTAIYLDGNGDYVDLASSYDINLGTSTEHTVSLWFKADDVSMNSQKQVIYDEGGAYSGFSIYLFDGKVYLGAWDNSAGWSGTFLSSDQIGSGQWHHVALVLDGGPTMESDALTAYLDGQKIASGAGMQMSNHSELQLGQVFGTSRYHDGGGTDPNNYTGALDDVRVYRRALSYSEVVGLNDMPSGTSNTVGTLEDTDHVFTAAEFGISDLLEGGSLANLVITTAPSNGMLYNDANANGIVDGGEALVATGVVSAADITAGRFKFKPAGDANGLAYDSFTFQVQDDDSDTDPTFNTMTIDVAAINDAPSFITLGNQTVAEDSGPHTVGGFATAAAGGGADESGQTFTYNVSNNNAGLFAVAPSIDAGGTLTYTLAAHASGTATVTVSVTDSGGIADGGVDTSPDQTFAITVDPVIVNSTIVEVRVAAGSDDAEENPTGSVVLTSSDLELTTTDKGNQTIGIRFNGLDIPQGAMILDAYIQFQVDEKTTIATDLTIQGENVDNAATFAKLSGNISSRPRTAASVNWLPAAWDTVGAAGPEQRTPDIASVIQEIVNRSGWADNNSLAIIITGTGERVAESYNGVPAAAPLLHVEYTTSSNHFPMVEAGSDQSMSVSDTAVLDATVTDDGQPLFPGTVTTLWTQEAGAGDVTFLDATSIDTTATFSQPGTYVLRLTADDGQLTNYDELTIDVLPDEMLTLDIRVSAGSDDAEEFATGHVTNSSSDLELVFDRDGNQTVGMRFNGVSIPQGATIVDAYIQFQVDEVSSVATNLMIQGENVDSADTFSTVAGSISSRPRTGAAVNWEPQAWDIAGEAGPDQRTPNIAAVIQEIVNRSGWADNNSLAIIITGNGERGAESYDGQAAAAPLLHIEYSLAGAASQSQSPPFATLVAAATAGHGPVVGSAVTDLQVRTIFDAAVLRWSAVVGNEAAAELAGVSIEVADLADGYLSLAWQDGRVQIDDDAAGLGWYIDSTPLLDDEFVLAAGGDTLLAGPDSPAFGKVDLVTAMLHELGHQLGYDHSDEGLMAQSLATGTRRLPAADATAALAMPENIETAMAFRSPRMVALEVEPQAPAVVLPHMVATPDAIEPTTFVHETHAWHMSAVSYEHSAKPPTEFGSTLPRSGRKGLLISADRRDGRPFPEATSSSSRDGELLALDAFFALEYRDDLGPMRLE